MHARQPDGMPWALMSGPGSVFISHTSDMASFPTGRSFIDAVREAVLKAGFLPVDTAHFPARDEKPATYCQQRVLDCDVYLAVVGFRYGSLVPDRPDRISYTELEFITATEHGLPRLIFLLDDGLDDGPYLPREFVDRDSTAINAFRFRLRNAGLLARMVLTPEMLHGEVLHALYDLRDERRRTVGASADPGGTRWRPWMVPVSQGSVTDRPMLVDALLAGLTVPNSAGNVTTVLEGVAGFGKTTLAAQICHLPQISERFPGGLLWTTIGEQCRDARLASAAGALCETLAGRPVSSSDPMAVGVRLGELLDEREPTLLVIDDVWRPEQLAVFLIGGSACRRLVTTRNAGVAPYDSTPVLVGAMSEDQAMRTLTAGVENLPEKAARALLRSTGRWPVLLALVNAALTEQVKAGASPREAAVWVCNRLERDGPTAFDDFGGMEDPASRNRAVEATVAASMDLLTDEDRDRYFDLAVFPETIDVPLDVLELFWRTAGRLNEQAAEQLRRRLVRLRLALGRWAGDQPAIRLHDVLRTYLRHRLGADELRLRNTKLLSAAERILPDSSGFEHPRPWWLLPQDAGYMWSQLPYHLAEAGETAELDQLVCDLRWVQAKTALVGSLVPVETDLTLVDSLTAALLRRVLAQSADLFGPHCPPSALGPTLASVVGGVQGLQEVVESFRTNLPSPRLDPIWPLPDVPDSALARTLIDPATGVTGCAFSPDGGILATVGIDGKARLWRIIDGTIYAECVGHTARLTACAFSPDGEVLATVSLDGTARLWQVSNGSQRAVFASHADGVTGCAFSPDGEILATVSLNGIARLWRVTDGTTYAQFTCHTAGVTCCAFSPDGEVLATASFDGTARFWRVADETTYAECVGHAAGVTCCTFSPNGEMLATVSPDGTARLWHVSDGSLHKVFVCDTGGVTGCAFSPGGEVLAAVGFDGTTRLWRVADGTTYAQFTGHTAGVNGCAFSPDGDKLATSGVDGTIRLWRVAETTAHDDGLDGNGLVTSCAFRPDGTLLATAGADGFVRLWRVADGSKYATLAGHTGRVTSCAFSPDGILLASAGADGFVRLWRADGSQYAVLAGQTGGVTDCTFSPDGDLLATTGVDGSVRLWRVAGGAEGASRTELTGHDGWASCCAFSPDGALLATSSLDGPVRIWGVSDGLVQSELAAGAAVSGCAFSPDGALLATTGADGSVLLWRIFDGTVLASLVGHTDVVTSCTFSPDGTVLVTTGSDRTIRLWHIPTRACLSTLRVARPLEAASWHPDGGSLCAAGHAGVYMFTYVS
jgi:WD40 repeat protein